MNYWHGYLICALECDPKENGPGLIIVYNATTLRPIGWRTLRANDAPWCAVNPVDGLLYTSPYLDGYASAYVDVYAFDTVEGVPAFDSTFSSLLFLGSIKLYDEKGSSGVGDAELAALLGVGEQSGLYVKGIQGGAFSPRGHLFLAVTYDVPEFGFVPELFGPPTIDEFGVPGPRMVRGIQYWSGGIMGFDLVTGRRVVNRSIEFNPGPYDEAGVIITDTEDELEAVLIADIPDGAWSGQVHAIVSKLGYKLYFKHLSADWTKI